MTKCKCLNGGEIIINRDCPVHGETAMPEKWHEDNPTDSQADEWLDELFDFAINVKQAAVDFAAEAELFGDNDAVLSTANVELDNYRKKFKAAIQTKLAEAEQAARIDENNRHLMFHIDEDTSTGYKAGFADALAQLEAYRDGRHAELQQRQALNERSE